jgi:rubrerythrin
MTATTDWNAVLQKALAMEDEGRNYYLAAAERITFHLGRRTFEALAADEAIHKSRIIAIHDLLATGGAWGDGEVPAAAATAGPSLFAEAMGKVKALKPETGDIEALDRALDLEKASWTYYDGLAKESTGSATLFFRKLADEENIHFRLVEETLTFLKQSWEEWQQDEKPIFEG